MHGTVPYGMLYIAGEPTKLEDAIGNPRWKSAMDALIRNRTWHLVPEQRSKNIIECKWVYKIKKKADGSVDRYKARQLQKDLSNAMG